MVIRNLTGLGSSRKNERFLELDTPLRVLRGAGPANEGFYSLSAKTIDGFLAVKKKRGGGFKDFLCSPLFGEDFQFDSYSSDGLKPPTG